MYRIVSLNAVEVYLLSIYIMISYKKVCKSVFWLGKEGFFAQNCKNGYNCVC